MPMASQVVGFLGEIMGGQEKWTGLGGYSRQEEWNNKPRSRVEAHIRGVQSGMGGQASRAWSFLESGLAVVAHLCTQTLCAPSPDSLNQNSHVTSKALQDQLST